ncbi:hypothetical protein EOM39_00775 [Candidatus Gracilibacteria bacterium]|nr:hypothetical protein [Candidatus Gracilibacteria bacterium]
MQNNGVISAVITSGVTDGLDGFKISKIEGIKPKLSVNQKIVTVANDVWDIITQGDLGKATGIIKDLYYSQPN